MVKRGFKSWCEKLAAAKRAELSLDPPDPLNAWDLAKHMGTLVWYPSQIKRVSTALQERLAKEPGSWSAATILHPKHTLIILNEAHSRPRQSNDLMHELAHLICGHRPAETAPVEANPFLVADYDGEQEEEADLLAATLLLPRVALVAIAELGLSKEVAADRFVVSTQLFEMRMRRAGVYTQFARRALFKN